MTKQNKSHRQDRAKTSTHAEQSDTQRKFGKEKEKIHTINGAVMSALIRIQVRDVISVIKWILLCVEVRGGIDNIHDMCVDPRGVLRFESDRVQALTRNRD